MLHLELGLSSRIFSLVCYNGGNDLLWYFVVKEVIGKYSWQKVLCSLNTRQTWLHSRAETCRPLKSKVTKMQFVPTKPRRRTENSSNIHPLDLVPDRQRHAYCVREIQSSDTTHGVLGCNRTRLVVQSLTANMTTDLAIDFGVATDRI